MDPSPDLEALGARLEALLDELRLAVIPREYARVEEAVRLVTEIYGNGLARAVAIVERSSPALLDELARDELVGGLLVVHGLHPATLVRRVEDALASVRPFLAHHDGDVELLDVDDEVGAVRLRLLGSCDGCPSSSVTLQLAVEKAIHEAAPEVVIIDVDTRSSEVVPAGAFDGRSVPVALGRKGAYEHCPTALVEVAAG